MMGWFWYDLDFFYKLWYFFGWMGGYYSDEFDKLLIEMCIVINFK